MDFYEQKGLLNITDFPLGVAHSIHSMTIGKYYFLKVLSFKFKLIQTQQGVPIENYQK